MKISGSHRSGEFRNLGEFRKLSTFQVPQHREQGDNTGRLKVMDNNPKTWQLQDLPVYKVLLFFPKKRPRSAEFYFSLENMQHFEGSENKLTQTRTYNVNFICIYDLTWCPVFLHSVHPNSISLHHNGITPWLVHNLDALLTFKVLYSELRYFYNNTEPDWTNDKPFPHNENTFKYGMIGIHQKMN